MSSSFFHKYRIGTIITFRRLGVRGIVTDHIELEDGLVGARVKWDAGPPTRVTEAWLDEQCEIVKTRGDQ